MSKAPIPRPSYRRGRRYDWPRIIADARRIPNTWSLAAASVSAYAVRLVNQRRNPDLWTTGGSLRARGINPHTVDGHQHVDLLVAWIPDE